MDAITKLARPEILAMKPYSSARKEGEQKQMSIFLDANENPYPPFPGTSDCEGLNYYPEPQPRHLLELFAALYGVSEEQLLLTRGADEAIDLLVRAFCAAGKDAILINTPAFVMYETAAKIQHAGVVSVPLIKEKGFQLDVASIMANLEKQPGIKLVFICSPNNPTANLMKKDDIVALCKALLGKALVIVDEAYVEFSGQPSFAREVTNYPNLVVLRTLSKEYSLAGERCGITIAHPEVISIMGRIIPPYPLTVTSIRAITKAMSKEGVKAARAHINTLIAEREKLAKAFKASPAALHVYPSDTNYLLVQVQDPKLLVRMMEEKGIKIRDRSNIPAIEGCVRISVGTEAQNQQLLQVFDMFAEKMKRIA